jgi:hypothetical protein
MAALVPGTGQPAACQNFHDISQNSRKNSFADLFRECFAKFFRKDDLLSQVRDNQQPDEQAEDDDLLSLSPQPSILSTVTHGANNNKLTKVNGSKPVRDTCKICILVEACMQ